jgi:hypothetical protein
MEKDSTIAVASPLVKPDWQISCIRQGPICGSCEPHHDDDRER